MPDPRDTCTTHTVSEREVEVRKRVCAFVCARAGEDSIYAAVYGRCVWAVRDVHTCVQGLVGAGIRCV